MGRKQLRIVVVPVLVPFSVNEPNNYLKNGGSECDVGR